MWSQCGFVEISSADAKVSRGFNLAAAMFAFLALGQMMSGIWLFHLQFGWTGQSLTQAFFLPPMSFQRYLESALPHIGAVSVVTFIVGHFLSFDQNLKSKTRVLLGKRSNCPMVFSS